MDRYKYPIIVVLFIAVLGVTNPPLGFRRAGFACSGSPERSERLSLVKGQWILSSKYKMADADSPPAECGAITTYTQYLY